MVHVMKDEKERRHHSRLFQNSLRRSLQTPLSPGGTNLTRHQHAQQPSFVCPESPAQSICSIASLASLASMGSCATSATNCSGATSTTHGTHGTHATQGTAATGTMSTTSTTLLSPRKREMLEKKCASLFQGNSASRATSFAVNFSVQAPQNSESPLAMKTSLTALRKANVANQANQAKMISGEDEHDKEQDEMDSEPNKQKFSLSGLLSELDEQDEGDTYTDDENDSLAESLAGLFPRASPLVKQHLFSPSFPKPPLHREQQPSFPKPPLHQDCSIPQPPLHQEQQQKMQLPRPPVWRAEHRPMHRYEGTLTSFSVVKSPSDLVEGEHRAASEPTNNSTNITMTNNVTYFERSATPPPYLEEIATLAEESSSCNRTLSELEHHEPATPRTLKRRTMTLKSILRSNGFALKHDHNQEEFKRALSEGSGGSCGTTETGESGVSTVSGNSCADPIGSGKRGSDTSHDPSSKSVSFPSVPARVVTEDDVLEGENEDNEYIGVVLEQVQEVEELDELIDEKSQRVDGAIHREEQEEVRSIDAREKDQSRLHNDRRKRDGEKKSRTSSGRHRSSHHSNTSSSDHLSSLGHRSSKKSNEPKEEKKTKEKPLDLRDLDQILECTLQLDSHVSVIDLPWTELTPPHRQGSYSGMVNTEIRPHGKGTWICSSNVGGDVDTICGNWYNGSFVTEAWKECLKEKLLLAGENEGLECDAEQEGQARPEPEDKPKVVMKDSDDENPSCFENSIGNLVERHSFENSIGNFHEEDTREQQSNGDSIDDCPIPTKVQARSFTIGEKVSIGHPPLRSPRKSQKGELNESTGKHAKSFTMVETRNQKFRPSNPIGPPLLHSPRKQGQSHSQHRHGSSIGPPPLHLTSHSNKKHMGLGIMPSNIEHSTQKHAHSFTEGDNLQQHTIPSSPTTLHRRSHSSHHHSNHKSSMKVPPLSPIFSLGRENHAKSFVTGESNDCDDVPSTPSLPPPPPLHGPQEEINYRSDCHHQENHDRDSHRNKDDLQKEEKENRQRFRNFYILGEDLRSNGDIIHGDESKAFHELNSEKVSDLKIHDFAFVKRSSGNFTYAILANRLVQYVPNRRHCEKRDGHAEDNNGLGSDVHYHGKTIYMSDRDFEKMNESQFTIQTDKSGGTDSFMGEDSCLEEVMVFVISPTGLTKTIRKGLWGRLVRCVKPEVSSQSFSKPFEQPAQLEPSGPRHEHSEVSSSAEVTKEEAPSQKSHHGPQGSSNQHRSSSSDGLKHRKSTGSSKGHRGDRRHRSLSKSNKEKHGSHKHGSRQSHSQHDTNLEKKNGLKIHHSPNSVAGIVDDNIHANGSNHSVSSSGVSSSSFQSRQSHGSCLSDNYDCSLNRLTHSSSCHGRTAGSSHSHSKIEQTRNDRFGRKNSNEKSIEKQSPNSNVPNLTSNSSLSDENGQSYIPLRLTTRSVSSPPQSPMSSKSSWMAHSNLSPKKSHHSRHAHHSPLRVTLFSLGAPASPKKKSDFEKTPKSPRRILSKTVPVNSNDVSNNKGDESSSELFPSIKIPPRSPLLSKITKTVRPSRLTKSMPVNSTNDTCSSNDHNVHWA